MMLGGKEVATDAFDGRGMRLLGIVAEASALLYGHGQVRAYHGLKVTEAAHDRAVIPGIGVGRGVRISIEGVTIVGGGVMEFDIGGGGV